MVKYFETIKFVLFLYNPNSTISHELFLRIDCIQSWHRFNNRAYNLLFLLYILLRDFVSFMHLLRSDRVRFTKKIYVILLNVTFMMIKKPINQNGSGANAINIKWYVMDFEQSAHSQILQYFPSIPLHLFIKNILCYFYSIYWLIMFNSHIGSIFIIQHWCHQSAFFSTPSDNSKKAVAALVHYYQKISGFQCVYLYITLSKGLVSEKAKSALFETISTLRFFIFHD